MKVIDIHNHLYPKEWMDYLEGRTGSLTLKRIGPREMIFYYKGARLATVSRAGHYDTDARMKDLDEYGIDSQIISLTTPSVELISRKEGVIWAKKVNDYLAAVCEKHKNRLYAYATLPLQDGKESVKELERAYKDLGAKGTVIFSNIKGMPIYSPKCFPIYEAAEEYKIPIFIHPAPPLTTEVMKKAVMPLPLFGFILDTTMAVTGLIFQGVLERFSRLKVIHAHLGGVFPYMVGRIDDSFKSYSKDHGFSLPQLPSEYYKRNVYIDAISFYLPAMKCALEFLGPDHILMGTDYAHPVGGPERVVHFIKDLGLPEEETEKILWKNAVKLFRLNDSSEKV
jgi:aminocarboxymuconate-semialdehyde decarboxylase